MKKDINLIKRSTYQKELQNTVTEYRNALQKHFESVFFKAKNLIDTRWGDGENGRT